MNFSFFVLFFFSLTRKIDGRIVLFLTFYKCILFIRQKKLKELVEATKLTVAYFFELTLLNQKSLVMSRFARDKMNWINFRDCSSQYRNNVCNYWLSGQLENSNVLPNPNPEVNSWIEAGLSLFVGLKTLVTLLSLIL